LKFSSIKNYFDQIKQKSSSFLYKLRYDEKYSRKFKRRLWVVVFLSPLIIVFMWLVLYLTILSGLFGKLPGKKQLGEIENQTSTEIYAHGGELLGKYFIYDRTHVTLDQISPHVVNSLIATEDVRFYQHRGVDYHSMGRVLVRTLIMRQSSSGGGSTISQQLAKNLYPRERNNTFYLPVSKIKEMIIARRLEKVYGKDDLLLFYLNTVPFGENVFGISAASFRFFNKNPKDLNIEEAALLIGMLKATTFFNPRHHPERALQRRNTVIGQLKKYGHIDEPAADSLLQIPLKLNYSPLSHNQGPAPYFREMARLECDRIITEYNEKNGTSYNLYTDGLKVYTTIDYSLQVIAERALRKQMTALQKVMDAHYRNASIERVKPLMTALMQSSPRYKALHNQKIPNEQIEEIFNEKIHLELFSWDKPVLKDTSPLDSIFQSQKILHSSLVSIDPLNGFIKAWIGGNDYRYFQFDNVLARRQAGSAFKPFLYATAIEKGIDPCEFVSNEIRVYEDYDDWAPTNADGEHDGFYSMKGALAYSSNTVSAWYITQTGISDVVETVKKAGITSNIPQVPSLALGTAEVSLLEMTTAYAVFINNGYTISPQWLLKIEDKNGKVLYEYKNNFEPQKVISEETALMVSDMLQAVVQTGTGASLTGRFGITSQIAGKTGTTQNNADTWFVGFSPRLITGVWTGIENPAFARLYRTPLGSGASAVPLWGEFAVQTSRQAGTRKYFEGQFAEIPDSLAAIMDCALYLDELPVESWFEQLFRSPEERRERGVRRPRERERETRFRRFLRDLFQQD
jgi:penicillin-binding protein 1A